MSPSRTIAVCLLSKPRDASVTISITSGHHHPAAFCKCLFLVQCKYR